MKKVNFLIVLSLITLSISLACNKSDIVADKTKVTIIENDSQLYELTAQYSEFKTKRVKEIVNEKLAPEVIFKSFSDDVDAKYTMNDGTSFYVKSSKCSLTIKFDKVKNSDASYQKIKSLFTSISNVLK